MMARKSMGDLLSSGLILMAIFIFIISLKEPSILLKLIGLIGATITFMVEAVFLWQKIFRK